MAAYRGSQLKFVVASLMAGLTMVTLPGRAAASTPTLMWTGAKRVNILCNVAGGAGIDHLALSTKLCSDVLRIARRGAPMPVATIALGDPAALAGDAVTLLVHASVSDLKSERLMAFSIRPSRTASEGEVLFGAVPRAAPISRRGSTSPALDAALTAALSEILPWLSRPAGARPIR